MAHMTAQTIDTISEFMLHAGTDYRVYDMGRGIESMDSQKFIELEKNQLPAPCPRTGHAWFGIVFWNKKITRLGWPNFPILGLQISFLLPGW